MFRVIATRLNSQGSTKILNRNLASGAASGAASDSGTSKPKASPPVQDVPGFTNVVVNVPEYPVGFAGAAKDKEYKNPEYFCYHVDSFGDSMVELEKYRLPAPSSKSKAKK